VNAADRRARARAMRGRRAGLITRLIADAIDLLFVVVLLFAALVAVGVVMYMLGDGRFRLPHAGPVVTAIAYPVTEIVYLSYAWGSRGRSLGKDLLGLRVLQGDGRRLRPVRAFGRAVFVTFLGGPSLLWVAVSRRNLAVHDIVLHTAVVHDWSTASTAPAPPAPPVAPVAVTAEFRNPARTG
jgi:uncharacterized RDD family membrane protein YckC